MSHDGQNIKRRKRVRVNLGVVGLGRLKSLNMPGSPEQLVEEIRPPSSGFHSHLDWARDINVEKTIAYFGRKCPIHKLKCPM